MTDLSDEAVQIEALIEEFQRSGLRELHVRNAAFELYLSQDADAGGVSVRQEAAAASVAAPPAPSATEPVAASAPVPLASLPPGTTAVTAPYLGTFYRSPKPGAPAFVEIGGRVEPTSDLCLVEVMKLFTAVRAGVSGTVEAVFASDGQMVEAGQLLFAIRVG